MAKSDNLLAILWMLRSRKRMTAGQIADELEVDIRTVYRYIDALCASGAPIYAETGPNGGYALLDTFRETPLFFSAAERIALTHAGLFARLAGYPYSSALASALAKVERQLNPEQLADLQLHAEGLDVLDAEDGIREQGGSPHLGLEERLKAIESAVAARRRLKISHLRSRSEPPLGREVDPYGLLYWRENWYLIGYCHLRKSLRMFRCDRIVSVEATAEVFERPAQFSARDYFFQSMVPGDAARDEVTVRVRGTPSAIDSLSRHWFLRHFVRERSQRELGFAVDMEHATDYLPYVVLSNPTEMTITEPKELRDLVARLARSVAEDHLSTDNTSPDKTN